MKFKMKGHQATRHKLVELRKDMRNKANFSLLSEQSAYNLNWNLNFNDQGSNNKFFKDVHDSNTFTNK